MTSIRRALMVTALAVWPIASNAEVFKCVEDGKTVFQDKPCRGAGSAITVIPANQSVEKSKASEAADKPADESVMSRTKSHIETIERDRRKRDAEYELRDIDGAIQNAERLVLSYQGDQEVELAALRVKKSQANNNLAGAVWEQSISAEMQAVAEKYKSKIQIIQDRLSQLYRRRAALVKPS